MVSLYPKWRGCNFDVRNTSSLAILPRCSCKALPTRSSRYHARACALSMCLYPASSAHSTACWVCTPNPAVPNPTVGIFHPFESVTTSTSVKSLRSIATPSRFALLGFLGHLSTGPLLCGLVRFKLPFLANPSSRIPPIAKDSPTHTFQVFLRLFLRCKWRMFARMPKRTSTCTRRFPFRFGRDGISAFRSLGSNRFESGSISRFKIQYRNGKFDPIYACFFRFRARSSSEIGFGFKIG